MLFLGLTRWTLAGLSRRPWFWILVLGVLSPWILLARLAPLGLTTLDWGEEEFLTEALFLTSLAGTCCGLLQLARAEPFLYRLSPSRRLLQELGILLLLQVLLQTLLLLALDLLALGQHEHQHLAQVTTPSPGGVDLASLLSPGVVFLNVHLGLLATILLRIRMSSGIRLPAFLGLAWIVPAVFAPSGWLGEVVESSLDGTRHLANGSQAQHTLIGWVGVLASLAGLALAAALLTSPYPSRR